VVLVDHATEDLPAPHRRANRHDLLLVMIGWPLLPGLVWTVPVVVPALADLIGRLRSLPAGDAAVKRITP
jgi:hypothetical protein